MRRRPEDERDASGESPSGSWLGAGLLGRSRSTLYLALVFGALILVALFVALFSGTGR